MAKMQAAVQAGVPPDLSYHALSIPQMQSLDIVEDVTDVVDELVKQVWRHRAGHGREERQDRRQVVGGAVYQQQRRLVRS